MFNLILILFIFILVNSVNASNGFDKSSLTLGTKEASYQYEFHNLNPKLYFRQDDYGQRFEDGFVLSGNTNKGKPWLFKLSMVHKDNLLDSSVLAKIEISGDNLWKNKILHSQKQSIGYFYLPSLFGAEKVGQQEKFQTYPAKVLVFKFDQGLSWPHLFHKTEFDWEIGLSGLLSPELEDADNLLELKSSAADMIDAFSYLKCDLSSGIKRQIASKLWLVLKYKGFFRTANYQKIIPPLQNHELSAHCLIDLGEPKSFAFRFYEPLRTDLIAIDSLKQGRRAEVDINLKDWQFKCLWKGKYPDESFINPTGNYVGMTLNRVWNKMDTGLFWHKNKDNRAIGVQLSIGQKASSKIIEATSEKMTIIPESAAIGYSYPEIKSPNLAGKSFEEVVSALDTPEKVAGYITGFNYFDDHNDISGLFDLYTPWEVFQKGGGNCTEQSGFEAYVLRQHGYEAYNIGEIARSFTHAICIYKDEYGWNALDYWMMYKVGANTPEELLNMIYPGWFSLTIKDPNNGKSIRQIDSSSKTYLLNWLEE
ncbi:MAG: hypothetical protein HY761_09645 [Candidatus Omnitrophica bacterium]|nr:hypothetical protein [Candidatus Omnitrophota bacterium]